MFQTFPPDYLKSFNKGLEGLDVSKLMQVSMDGPHVNFKFLGEFKKERNENELTELVDIGSCGLHIIHGAFKPGSEATNWDLHKVLKGAFTLLRDTPARRDDYVTMTGGSSYPLQFCGTRWIEDKKVAERLIKIWPNFIKLYDFWDTDEIQETQFKKLQERQSWYKRQIDFWQSCIFFVRCWFAPTVPDILSRRCTSDAIPKQ